VIRRAAPLIALRSALVPVACSDSSSSSNKKKPEGEDLTGDLKDAGGDGGQRLRG
jgi:hypothetical protein